MPNTLAHFAVNGLASRTILPKAPLPLIYLGCVVPDLPWILQRAVNGLMPRLDHYDVRVYCINQASLISCVLFSLAAACLFDRWKTAFSILAFGSLLHLLLDAFEIKWSNGVSLFVPVSWELLSFRLFWPESIWTTLLTLFGLVYFILNFRKAVEALPRFCRIPWRWGTAIALFAAWMVLPVFWMDRAFEADNHEVATLHPDHSHERPGKPVELDRIPFKSDAGGGGDLVIFGGERVRAENFDPGHDAKVSVQGRFSGVDRIAVTHSHIHHGWFREVASYLGLALVLLVWIWAPVRGMLREKPATSDSPHIS